MSTATLRYRVPVEFDPRAVLKGLGDDLSAETGPWTGRWVLDKLKAKDQEYFGFVTDEFDTIFDDGILLNPTVRHGLRLTRDYDRQTYNRLVSQGGKGQNIRLPYAKFVHYVFNPRAQNPYGRGLGSVCYWYSWFKGEGGFKFWMIFLEKYGTQIRKRQDSHQTGFLIHNRKEGFPSPFQEALHLL